MVKKNCGNKSMFETTEEALLKWFGCMEGMSEERLTRWVCVSE